MKMLFQPRLLLLAALSAAVPQALLEHFMLGVATLKGHRLINQYRHVTEEE